MENLQEIIYRAGMNEEFRSLVAQHTENYKEMMAFYSCAIMEVETKFKVLSSELSLNYDRNPIETIKSRLKEPQSIYDKLNKNGFPLTLESIEKNLYDVAGLRVICTFLSDVYALAETFLSQDDVFLLEKKDYIQNPKENGYRSLHLIVETPIYLHDRKKMMKVEVQFRTLAMDWWASLEHKIRYKKGDMPAGVDEEIQNCAEICAQLDKKMEQAAKAASNR